MTVPRVYPFRQPNSRPTINCLQVVDHQGWQCPSCRSSGIFAKVYQSFRRTDRFILCATSHTNTSCLTYTDYYFRWRFPFLPKDNTESLAVIPYIGHTVRCKIEFVCCLGVCATRSRILPFGGSRCDKACNKTIPDFHNVFSQLFIN